MVDENNLGDGLEIQDSQPQDNAESTNVDSAPEGENTESSKETPAEAKESKVKALLAQVTGRIQPLLTQVKENKLLLIGLIVIAVLVLLLIIVFIIFALSGDDEKEESAPPPISRKIVQPAPILSGPKRLEVDDTELGNMIKKANILYEQGDKLEALDIFDSIAAYSQSIAYYNLGVIKIKEGDYQKAINSFDGAISVGEDISVSAFNAAYSAYMLGDMNLYEYYLGISSNYLYHTANQPLYSYLYGLLQYYKGFYFESLSPFLNPSSQSYSTESKRLASEVFLIFGDEYNALAQLKQASNRDDNLAIALLHARLGEYGQAKQYLYEYLGAHPGDPQALMALQLIELKGGNYKEGALILDRLNAKEEDAKVFDVYPIKAKLRDELFDINLAQENFWNRRFEHNKMLGYKILFYYAPFLVFDAKQALAIIDDGNLNAYSSNIESAKSILQEGQKVSQINNHLANDLRSLALNQDIRDTIKSMEKSLKTYPNHSVLHYDVGLLYAQMNDFDNAYLHFIRAYHLDSNNTMAGIFALMCAELTYRDRARLINSISNDLAEIDFTNQVENQFLLSLFRYTSDAPADSLDWLNDMKKQPVFERKPIYFALEAVYAIYTNNDKQLVDAFEYLKKIYAKDVVANTMYELGKRFRLNLKDVALQMNAMYKDKKLDMNSIYYGPSLARELYIYVGFVTGSLRSIQEELEARLVVETRTNNGILQALALSNIYSNDFEKAFALYNSLLDDLHEEDSQTRFLSAIAAMGANRHENAVALLQLTKNESPTNFEARYALGLLYQEGKNMRAATQHYDRLANSKFESEFFDFEIDTSYLLDVKD
ncbi:MULTISPECIES: tetratricopeptide repeat protein [Helicobacter]|uniref:PUTATIVE TRANSMEMBRANE PROTEIN n=4 Tax=Helicobacter typhlonius TaxID=76936 RepID=A0A099UE16_9HELI|nr:MULTISPECIES: tetratricopeptide repeat protein [Helicobacter]TLD79225.1 tetratricopeptide repeat protein [Helicobacter typhlonius]TLD86011.1 tetratricopeptide repeat protein [Helicobacter sp. MIT 03-1616]CUU40572.1 PUTATIVE TRANSMEMBRANE PROTEIN [Helicobacter typhlonius]HCD73164.1 tetratricopeptide repeat protein [Helicobacter sp.]